ncbi:MAG: hypothetical protein AAC990_00120 [Dehalococcoides mccartyi]|jgi:hypothetical protein|uniref:hypothetical protein n=1 Tax=Dehalococcoides mccartyi TaxID=61435 RepID=UPI002A63F5A9|nr:hypothetical protein [Candidatus Omnitrophota bacterium]
MGGDFKLGDKVKLREWGEGEIIGACPWWEPGARDRNALNMKGISPGKVWLVKLGESGKIVSSMEAGLTKV